MKVLDSFFEINYITFLENLNLRGCSESAMFNGVNNKLPE